MVKTFFKTGFGLTEAYVIKYRTNFQSLIHTLAYI